MAMNSAEREELNPRQARVRELVGALDEPAADPVFRERLKAQFVAGTIPRSEHSSKRGRTRIPPRVWMRVVVPLAAAAAIVLIFGVLNQGPSWSMIEGEGSASIDGVPVSLDDSERVDGMLHEGAVVQMEAESRACFLQGELILTELTPHARVTLPGAPSRWSGGGMHGIVHTGVVRWVTGPAFPGHRLAIATPESMVEVTGTSFSLMCTEGGTCVCVLEGDVKVTDEIAGSEVVPGGQRKTMFRTGSRPDYGDMHETERTALTRLVQLVEARTSP
jgi:ferric-dicitrate binding protein FerR (iron transport regulator)